MGNIKTISNLDTIYIFELSIIVQLSQKIQKITLKEPLLTYFLRYFLATIKAYCWKKVSAHWNSI